MSEWYRDVRTVLPMVLLIVGLSSGAAAWIFKPDPLTALIFAVFVTIIFDRVAAIFDSHMTRKDAVERDSVLKELMRDGREDICALSSNEAKKQIIEHSVRANRIINTNVNIVDPVSTTLSEKEVESFYGNFLGRNSKNVWNEIVGISELFGDRYKNIVTENYEGDFRVTTLRHSAPLINFTYLEFENRKEVYFGQISKWTGTSKVFYSQSIDLCDMFELYGNTLIERYSWQDGSGRRIKLNSSQSISDQTQIIDKSGIWLTVLKNKKKIASIGVIEIGFPQGEVQVDATLYELNDGALKPLSHSKHDKKTVVHYKDQIYFFYNEIDRFGKENSGICYYRFLNHSSTDKITGFLTRHDDEIKRTIAGIRVLEPCNSGAQVASALSKYGFKLGIEEETLKDIKSITVARSKLVTDSAKSSESA